MEGIEISTWEDVGGGEGRGSADTMEQENLVLRGDEQDAVGCVSWNGMNENEMVMEGSGNGRNISHTSN